MFDVYKTGGIQAFGATEYGGTTTISSDQVMTYRSDTNQCLGVVGADYQVMQPSDVRSLVTEVTGSDKVDTTWDGRTMITQAPFTKMLLPGEDEVISNFTVVNSFNGGTSLSGMGCSFRMFCSNQLSLAFKQAGNSLYRIRHNGDWDAKVLEFNKAAKDVRQKQVEFAETVKVLVKREVSQDTLNELWSAVTPIVLDISGKEDDRDKDLIKLSAYRTSCQNTFDEENSNGAPATMWLAANAVTKFVQHSVAKKGRKTDDNRRFVNNTIGRGARTTNEVMRAALAAL